MEMAGGDETRRGRYEDKETNKDERVGLWAGIAWRKNKMTWAPALNENGEIE